MKRVLAAVVLLLLVCTGCVLTLRTERRELTALTALAEQAQTQFCAGDTDAALATAQQLAAEFPERTRRFRLFLPHGVLAEAQKSAVSLPLILSLGEPKDFAAETRRFQLQLELLWRQELPTLDNIL